MHKAKTYLEFLTYHRLDQCQRLQVFLFILQVCPILTVLSFFRVRFYDNNDFVVNPNISKNFGAKIQRKIRIANIFFMPYIPLPEGEGVFGNLDKKDFQPCENNNSLLLEYPFLAKRKK